MKIATHIARVLLGLIFFVLGLNGIHAFLPMGPLPEGLAGQFITVLFQSHWVFFIGLFQAAAGALLLANRFVPLALAVLGPILVNIILYHSLMFHAGAELAILSVVLWIFLFVRHWQSFKSLFVLKTA